ncbi:sensor histidine kinase [Vreelandella piezotolerans]|uniref:sensor histidine kinase n=1 Tax=Vreelandella piezotolerans TaxID=2609667 RepID=UPI001C638AFE|nr:ATP-binding protein [Halomonas piezotolerans]
MIKKLTPPILRRLQWCALALVAFMLAAMVWQGIRVQEALLDANAAVNRHLESIALIQAFKSTLLDLETGERGYVITGQPAYLLPYQQARARLAHQQEQLRRISLPTGADDLLSEEVLSSLVERRMQIAESNISVRDTDGLEAAALRLLAAGGRQTMDRLRGHLNALEQNERERLSAQTLQATRQARQSRWVWGGGAAVIAALLLVTSLSVINQWRQRQRVMTMQKTFISTVSHELRTPLTVILGALSMLQSGVGGTLSADAQRLVVLSNDNGKRLKSLIDDILDIEKLESGQLTFQRQRLPLLPLVEHAVALNQPYAESFSVSLGFQTITTHDHAPHRPAMQPLDEHDYVNIDPERFAQIMANLISNACKHSDPGEHVAVSAGAIDSQWLEIHVCDHGNGIPLSFQPRVFERFAQADGTDRRRTGGTGLGLAITKSLVEEMGGSIGFHSVPTEGCCFWVRLPRVAKLP